ncbi:MAG: RluA family pseudouridine synthase [Rickettsiaceae bacterium]|nr:RluA family pseudouridine synthase [Rickettsiaceae bacterium]
MNRQSFSDYNIREKIRLDKLLAILSGISRSKIVELIKQGSILVEKLTCLDPSKIIERECLIEILGEVIREDDSSIKPKEIDIDVVYEDNDLIVINKQPYLTVHPGAGNYQDTLVNGLLYRYKNQLSDVNDATRPGIVHRLDRETSGLMVVAKNNIAHIELSRQIASKEAKRKYLCLVWGVPKLTNGTISTQIGRCAKDRTKMTILQYGGRVSQTDYSIKEIFANSLFSLVEATLATGRTHQIRVHMSHLGNSVVGDKVYGTNQRKTKSLESSALRSVIEKINRQALHAYYLGFTHPTTKEFIEFTTGLPDDMLSAISYLRDYK